MRQVTKIWIAEKSCVVDLGMNLLPKELCSRSENGSTPKRDKRRNDYHHRPINPRKWLNPPAIEELRPAKQKPWEKVRCTQTSVKIWAVKWNQNETVFFLLKPNCWESQAKQFYLILFFVACGGLSILLLTRRTPTSSVSTIFALSSHFLGFKKWEC